MKKKNRKVLVIGGSRFVGPLLIRRLLEHGDTVVLFNRGNNYGYTIDRRVIQIRGDRMNLEDVLKLKSMHFDIVYDMCAYNPHHITNTMKVLKNLTRHFVFFSTAAVYKESFIFPLSESASLGSWGSFGDYGENKALTEGKYLLWGKTKGRKVTIFRPVYILGKSNYFDRENYYFSRLHAKEKIIVPGNGKALIQFAFVEDVVEAFFRVPLIQKQKSEILNIGSSEYITVEGFINLCAQISKKTPTMVHLVNGRFAISETQFYDDLYPFPNVNLILSNERSTKLYKINYKPLKVGLTDVYKHWKKQWDGKVKRYELEKKILTRLNR
ncbi:NAD-dependent epimerase/dehydratase family protein [Candidatus Dojkabacteria bacterium]|nr:NAD-dependent epimerase/dehydratase family protein [Candidatus Dojkabacteria bacterium]